MTAAQSSGADELGADAAIAAELAAAMPVRGRTDGPSLEDLQRLDMITAPGKVDIAMLLLLAAPMQLLSLTAIGVGIPFFGRFLARAAVTMAGYQTLGSGPGTVVARAADLTGWLLAVTLTGCLVARLNSELWFGRPATRDRQARRSRARPRFGMPLRRIVGLEIAAFTAALPLLATFVPEWPDTLRPIQVALGIAAIPLLALLLLRWATAPTVVVAESLTARTALRRSGRLLGGEGLIGLGLSLGVGLLLVVPLGLLLLAGRDVVVGWLGLGLTSVTAQAVRILIEFVVACFVCALIGALGLPAYVDARIRREGLDCEMILARMLEAGR